MAAIEVTTPEGAAGRTVELPAGIFEQQVNIPLIHQVVVGQQAAGRQGTHSTKTRGEVRGGGKKPYRQKGTGRARQGSIRAPQFTGGGVVHGPKPRDYTQRTPKKMKAAALRGALTDRANHGRIHVVTEFVGEDVTAKRTQTALRVLREITQNKRILVVLEHEDQVNRLALRNLPEVHLLDADQVNTQDVLLSDDIVFTEKAYESFLRHCEKRAGGVREEAAQ
ncbi:50S ribosomal protein L4 [Spiractinospora alimapuensis]|uniref:50S ribosomal protein L4 n=1 Tax=Spiractinospora alimapuensis TaxID=2820884 RepID=UPI001EEA856C|nr:50S ribosomal protein L4 [Spiractinospora alimapuensis]QVQ51040.1 50S ribosomal protein L4 [Spiractinospora alimapuensis]